MVREGVPVGTGEPEGEGPAVLEGLAARETDGLELAEGSTLLVREGEQAWGVVV